MAIDPQRKKELLEQCNLIEFKTLPKIGSTVNGLIVTAIQQDRSVKKYYWVYGTKKLIREGDLKKLQERNKGFISNKHERYEDDYKIGVYKSH
jgi:hypothetical protein